MRSGRALKRFCSTVHFAGAPINRAGVDNNYFIVFESPCEDRDQRLRDMSVGVIGRDDDADFSMLF